MFLSSRGCTVMAVGSNCAALLGSGLDFVNLLLDTRAR